MGCSKSSSKREVYNNTILPQETRNISNKQSNRTPKAIRERRTTTTLKRISNPNTTLKRVTKLQKNKTGREEKRLTKTNPKELRKW